MQLIELVEQLIELQNDHKVTKVTAHKLTKVEQLVDLQNDLFFQALFSQKSLDKFWLSVYKSYLMIGVKAIKIMLPFGSMDFLLWQKLKAKNEKDFLLLTIKCKLKRSQGV